MSNSITFNHEEKGDNEDLMSAALMVEDGDAEEEGGPPQDGMAYLRQVMRERKRVPETVTAEIKPKKQKPDVAGGQKSSGAGGGDLGDLNSRTKVPPPPGCCPGAECPGSGAVFTRAVHGFFFAMPRMTGNGTWKTCAQNQ